MKAVNFSIALFTFFNYISFLDARVKVTLADLCKCKEYSFESMNSYRDFFEIKKFENAITSNEGNQLLRLKFYVQAGKNAYILLVNSTDALKPGDKVYEIVIGAGGNTFSGIYQDISSDEAVTKKYMNNILSEWDPTPIEIVLTRGKGTKAKLTVNLVGLDKPHLEWTDSDRLDINYVSFSSWEDTRAKWYYDCELNSK